MQDDLKIGLNITSNGTTDAEIKKAEKLKRALEEVSRVAGNAAGSTGGTAGSRKAAGMAGSASMSGQEYGQARGTAGATGASARDFANQAQGLGGLVRLYATYAANLFAVSAAFGALKQAADTTNLIKGLDQLGARSGMALGTLSKKLVETADGAISMRDAMEAVSKASSAGLTSDQILRLGNVAKKASQALGVDMSDAFSRLTRGISKLEPELLDELGLFTKIDPAVQKYALSVGRAASSLSDFEKRQAFAIAVLEEGEQKFNAIKLDVNPYAKLLATLKDVGQTVLEVVNVAVKPFVNYLSSSPTALLTVLAGIATLLVKQAIPAFGEFRSGLEANAEKARLKAIDKAKEVAVVQNQISDSVKARAEARIESEVQKVVAAEAKVNQLKQGSVDKQSKLYKILEKDLESITDKDLKRIDASAKALETKGLTKQAAVYRETSTAIRAYQEERKKYDVSLQKEIDTQNKAVKSWSTQGQVISNAEAAKRQAVRSSITTNAAYQASLVGVARAMQGVNTAIATAGITGISKFTLQVQAAGAALAGAISTVGATIQRFLGWIGWIVTAYAVFDSFADGAAESVQKFSSAVDDAKASAKNLLETYQSLKEDNPFSNEAVKARGTALTELSQKFNLLNTAALDAKKALSTSTWSNVKNNFAEAFGGGVKGNFAEAFAKQLTALLSVIEDPDTKKKITELAKLQLGITEVNFDNIVAAAKRLGPASVNIVELEGAIKGVATQAKIAGIASDTFAAAYKKVSDQIQQINQKFATTDDLANFAINSATALNSLSDLISQGVEPSMNGVVEALSGISRGASIFGTMTGDMSLLAAEAKKLYTEINKDTVSVDKLEKKLEALKNKRITEEEFTPKWAGGEMAGRATFDQAGYEAAVAELENQRRQTRKELSDAQARIDKGKQDFEKINAKVTAALPESLGSQTEALAIRLGAQIGKGANQYMIGLLSSFDAVPELVEKANKLKLAEIDTQIANTKALRDLTTATILSSASKRMETAQAARDAAMDSKDMGTRVEAQKQLDEATESYKLLEEASTKPIETLKKLAEMEKASIPVAIKYGDQIRQIAVRSIEANKALSDLSNQRLDVVLQGKIGVSDASYNAISKELDARKKLLDVEQQSLQSQRAVQESLSITSKIRLANDEERLKVNQANLQYEQTINNLAKESAKETIRILSLAEKDRSKPFKQLETKNKAETAAAEAARVGAIAAARAAADKELLELSKQQIDQRAKEQTYTLDTIKQSKEAEMQRQQVLLETNIELNKLYAEAAGVDSRLIASLEYQSTLKLAQASRDRTVTLANYELQRQQIAYNAEFEKLTKEDLADDEFTRRSNNLTRDFLLQKAQQKLIIEGADQQFLKTLQIADANKKIREEQAKQNDLLEGAAAIGDSFKSIFTSSADSVKRMVDALSGLPGVFAQIAVNTEQRAKSEKQALDAVTAARQAIDESGDDTDAQVKARKQLEDAEKNLGIQQKKNSRAQLDDDIRAISSAKKVFKEKTGAYKVLNAMEKAMHVQKMVMFAAEMGADLLKTGQAIINSVTRIGATSAEAAVDGTAAVVNQGKGDPYTAFARMAAMATFVAAILGKAVGGGKGSVPKGFTAKEQQEVQGTGQQYVGGQLVARQGGVLGDNTAKADSITSVIEKLGQEYFGSLSTGGSSTKIMLALESIKKNTGDTVKALLGNITGFGIAGSVFGTVEGSSKKLWGLWGSSSTSIANAGVRIEGTLDNLGQAIGKFERFESIIKTSSSWFGLVKNTSTYENTKAFEEQTTKVFANLFKSIQTVLLESATALEGPTSAAAEAIKSIPVTLQVSLKDLKGQEAIDAILGELSVQLNAGAQRIFPYLAQYQQIGEEYYETVARIVKESETLTIGLGMVGKAITNLGTEARIAVEQQLIEQLGGVDKAVGSINYYYENFLTNEERFRVQFNALTKTFRDAGRTLPQTKAEFVSLFASLDVNKEEDRATFALLLNNAESYNELLSLQSEILGDTTSKFAEFAKSLLSFKDSLLLGSATILTPIERYTKAKIEFDVIRAKALAGDSEALGKLQESSQTFLNVSRELYASGAQYTADFNSVLQTLDAAAGVAQVQSNIAQKQLDALNIQITHLANIDRALTGTPGHAGGGYASGLSIVGERGPELVDFSNPGRVYTADQTRGMFAPMVGTGQTFRVMVEELQDLREEVVMLRKEQQKQTGDMIVTNYDAQQKVADQIAEAVIQSVKDKSWEAKTKPILN